MVPPFELLVHGEVFLDQARAERGVRAPEGWNLPVGLSLSAEIGYQRRAFSPDTWTVELRPIIDKQWARWYVALNPTFERAIEGDNVGRGFEFSPAAKVSYSVTPKVAVGLEYYGALGPVTHIDRRRDQQDRQYVKREHQSKI